MDREFQRRLDVGTVDWPALEIDRTSASIAILPEPPGLFSTMID
jgi:hypothetical protein